MNAKAAKPAAKKVAPKRQAAKRSVTTGQFLPLQPPAFEPVLRTAAQWRSAARAVSK